MTRKKVYIVTDLGPGDGGKGGVVHKLSTFRRAHTIVKVGGAQGSHGVSTSAGERCAFSQWGCGTLHGVKTHISPRFVVSPEGLFNEARMLRYGFGEYDPFGLLTVDEGALCTTEYHKISSRLKELARGDNPRGTIGTGVGEAYRYNERLPELSIFVRDLSSTEVIREKLAAVRKQIQQDLGAIIAGPFLPEDQEAANELIQLLFDDGLLYYVVDRFEGVAKELNVVGSDYLGEEILSRDGLVVVESSHGILTDNQYGFHPHTSAIRTLPGFARGMIEGTGYDGEIMSLAVHRAYTIRHGAGPMPTADPAMGEDLLPGSHKLVNRYQGDVRVGPLDLPLLRYAIAASGGTEAYDGIAITWFDQVISNGEWQICNRYQTGTEDETYFTPSGELIVSHREGAAQLHHQEMLGQQLRSCAPETQVRRMPSNATREQQFELCADALNDRLGVPVKMVSLGPTELDKVFK